MFFLLFVTNVKYDKHTIGIMLQYDHKCAILLDKLRNREDFISIEFGYIIFRGVG